MIKRPLLRNTTGLADSNGTLRLSLKLRHMRAECLLVSLSDAVPSYARSNSIGRTLP